VKDILPALLRSRAQLLHIGVRNVLDLVQYDFQLRKPGLLEKIREVSAADTLVVIGIIYAKRV